MRKILGYLFVWYFYNVGRFIFYLYESFDIIIDESTKKFMNFTERILYIYYVNMERSYNIQQWCGLTKPW